MDSTLDKFQEVETGEAFTVQNPRLLKVELAEATVKAKLGAMVAYQGQVEFERAGSGMGRLLKKAATGESLRVMTISGSGEVFLAHEAQQVHILKLTGDTLTVNGSSILAFEADIDWDVKRVKGVSGVMSAGLFNIELTGTGLVALTSHGEPVKLDCGEAPTFADPQAAIAWSGVQTEVKTDVKAKSLVGLGSGEGIQMSFRGDGWVLVQPSEGFPIPTQ